MCSHISDIQNTDKKWISMLLKPLYGINWLYRLGCMVLLNFYLFLKMNLNNTE